MSILVDILILWAAFSISPWLGAAVIVFFLIGVFAPET